MPDECARVAELLSSFVDGEAGGDLCRLIEQHLRRCDACHTEVEELRRVAQLCRAFEGNDRPAPLTAQDRQALLSAFEQGSKD